MGEELCLTEGKWLGKLWHGAQCGPIISKFNKKRTKRPEGGKIQEKHSGTHIYHHFSTHPISKFSVNIYLQLEIPNVISALRNYKVNKKRIQIIQEAWIYLSEKRWPQNPSTPASTIHQITYAFIMISYKKLCVGKSQDSWVEMRIRTLIANFNLPERKWEKA